MRLFFSAGEVSGDFHASNIAKRIIDLTYRFPTKPIEMVGIGGELMRKAGIDILFDFTSLSSVGLIESILPTLKISFTLRMLRRYLKNHPVDLIILVDNQGMNLPIARLAKTLSIPIIYYFPPQVSIWGEWNSKKVASLVDIILSPFYEDFLIYKKAGGKVQYVGHPLLELVQVTKTKEEVAHSLYISTDYVIGLFPGSRKQEIKRLFPILLKTAQLIHDKYFATFLIPVSSQHFLPYLQRMLLSYSNLNIQFIEQADYNTYQLCDIAILCSGTVSLEMALLKIPMITIYQVNWFTYQVAKRLLKNKAIALPNILLKRNVVPELLQKDVNPYNLFEKADYLLKSPKLYSEMKNELEEISSLLGEGDTIQLVTQTILDHLSKE